MNLDEPHLDPKTWFPGLDPSNQGHSLLCCRLGLLANPTLTPALKPQSPSPMPPIAAHARHPSDSAAPSAQPRALPRQPRASAESLKSFGLVCLRLGLDTRSSPKPYTLGLVLGACDSPATRPLQCTGHGLLRLLFCRFLARVKGFTSLFFPLLQGLRVLGATFLSSFFCLLLRKQQPA